MDFWGKMLSQTGFMGFTDGQDRERACLKCWKAGDVNAEVGMLPT